MVYRCILFHLKRSLRTDLAHAVSGGLGPAVSITSAAARSWKDERQRTFRGVWDSAT